MVLPRTGSRNCFGAKGRVAVLLASLRAGLEWYR